MYRHLPESQHHFRCLAHKNRGSMYRGLQYSGAAFLRRIFMGLIEIPPATQPTPETNSPIG